MLLRDIDLKRLRDPTRKDIALTGGLLDRHLDVIIKTLQGCPREVRLNLTRNNFSPEAIMRLANSGIEFEYLNLTNCDVNEGCLKVLVSAGNIKRLNVSCAGCQFEDNVNLCDYIAENARQTELVIDGTRLLDEFLPVDRRGKIAARIEENRERLLREQVSENGLPLPVKPHPNEIANGTSHPRTLRP